MRYDLNLLKAFDILYKEQNVSRAAERLGISQPAMSATLAKLRELFKDPLFIRQRYGISPTEKSRNIHPVIESSLTDLDSLVQREQRFDLATAKQTFDIAANDYYEFLILPQLMQRLRKIAPQIRIQVTSLTQDVTEAGVMSGKSQFAFGRLNTPPDNLIIIEAVRDDFACLVSTRNTDISDTITLAQFEAQEHVIVRPSHKLKTGVFQVLAERNIKRHIKCEVTHFHFVPALIKNSQLIATLPKRI